MSVYERSSTLKHKEREKEAMLRSQLRFTTSQECQVPGMHKEEINGLKTQLEVIDKERYHGALVRARSERLFLGEAPTKRALSFEKRHANKNKVIESHGVVEKDQAGMERVFTEFYQNLFSCQPI